MGERSEERSRSRRSISSCFSSHLLSSHRKLSVQQPFHGHESVWGEDTREFRVDVGSLTLSCHTFLLCSSSLVYYYVSSFSFHGFTLFLNLCLYFVLSFACIWQNNRGIGFCKTKTTNNRTRNKGIIFLPCILRRNGLRNGSHLLCLHRLDTKR